MHTLSTLPSHSLLVNTSPAVTVFLTGARAGAAPRSHSRIAAALCNIRPRIWPDALQRAVTFLIDPATMLHFGEPAAPARHDLRTHLDKYKTLLGHVQNRSLRSEDHRVSHAYVDCGNALEQVVQCKEALDMLAGDKASQEALLAAKAKLEAASERAAEKIATLRQALNKRMQFDRCWSAARVFFAAVMFASIIVTIAFPPAVIVTGPLTIGAAASCALSSAADIFVTHQPFRVTRRAMDNWLRKQPPELMAAEQTLRARTSAAAAAAKAAAGLSMRNGQSAR